jgi:4-diphosphocytidyl-2-C-methyl-D-erythritol kinase
LLTLARELSAENLFNVFDSVADEAFEGLADYRRRFIKAGAEDVHLAGSGPALFTLLRDKAKAQQIYGNLKDMGLEAYIVEAGR